MAKNYPILSTKLEKIIGGGQALGTLDDGRKIMAWGGLPDEDVKIQQTKKKSNFVQGVVVEVEKASPDRIDPRDPDSFLSTSPWQIMDFAAEQRHKAQLIEEAFQLHDVQLAQPISLFSDGQQFGYRNKIEFSFWWDKENQRLDLAFFRRGSHGKIPVDGTSLAPDCINESARRLRDVLRKRKDLQAFSLKTVIVRCDSRGDVAMQLYVKDQTVKPLTDDELRQIDVAGFEMIFSNPKSPASVITERLQAWGETSLTDEILGTSFTYAVEGFFQINLPVYQQALADMRQWIDESKPTVDLYSGVGSIGLTIGGQDVTLVEIDQHAVREMRRNIDALERQGSAKAVLAPSEEALEHVTSEATIIVDPPRAGLHQALVDKLLAARPSRIVYLSCNPVTQARDVMLLSKSYDIAAQRGYNFFPRTPHIENLVVLDLKTS